MRDWLRRFMIGRYGPDDLNRVLSIAALILMIISMFLFPELLYPLALALFAISIFRMLSKNTYKRGRENEAYWRLRKRISGWFANRRNMAEQRNTHHFFRCPSCRTTLRVPKGKGRIVITCPKCRTTTEKMT